MAIQVNGTTVIDNSRNLTNIASYSNLPTQSTATWEAGTGTTETTVSPAKIKAAIESLGVSGIDAFAADWANPDETLTTSGTWSKPSGMDDKRGIWVLLVSAGGSANTQVYQGGWYFGGVGGRACAVFTEAGVLNGTSYTIGASIPAPSWTGGPAQSTYLTINGINYNSESIGVYTALSPQGEPGSYLSLSNPSSYAVAAGVNSNALWSSEQSTTGSIPSYTEAILGAGQGYSPVSSGTGGSPGIPSLHSGDGGGSGQPGQFPGGGGGAYGSNNGADGSIRIYYS